MRFFLSLIIGCLISGAHAAAPGEEGAELARSMGIAIPAPAPDRREGEGSGPHTRLVIDQVMLVDGLGSPPRGPVSIVVENDEIVGILPRSPAPTTGETRIDAKGMTALPGFIDAHVHIGNPLQGLAGAITPPEYVFKLWLAHGITTVRDVGSVMGLDWTVQQARRSERHEIAAPRIIPYAMFPGSSSVGLDETVADAEGAARWVKAVANSGAQGIKLRGGTREALASVYETAQGSWHRYCQPP